MPTQNSFYKNAKGFSALEMVIALGLVAALSLAVAQSYVDSYKMIQKAQMGITVKELKTRAETLLRDPYDPDPAVNTSAWLKTVYEPDNAVSMACLRQPAAGLPPPTCTPEFTAGVGRAFTIHNRYGVPEFYSISNTWNPLDANKGFTYKGEPCTTFNDVAGDANCVFGYEITWRPAVCPPGCVNPPVIIDFRLHYRPLGLIGLAPLDELNYSIMGFNRSSHSITKSFTVVAKESTSGINGGGACSGVGVKRKWSTPTVLEDPFSMVVLNGARDEITLQYDGTYNCSGTGSAFSVDNFKMVLAQPNAGNVIEGSGNAPSANGTNPGQTGSATFEGVFTAVKNDVISVSQTCSNGSGVGSPVPTTWGLGKPDPGNPDTVYATLTCFIEN